MFTSVTNAIKRISQYLGRPKGPAENPDAPVFAENFLTTKPEVVVESLPPSSTSTSFLMLVITNGNLLSLWCRLQSFRWIGAVSALFSVIFWSLSGLSFKLNKEMHALQILMISSMIVSIVYLAFIFLFYGVRKSSALESKTERTPIWILLFGIPGERFSLLMRCFCGTLSLACYYTSLHYIPMGDATTIRFTSPVFIAILAHFLVHEPFGWLQLINSIITLLGVFLIGRPSFIFQSLHITSGEESEETISKSDTLIGILLSLSAAITISVSMIFMRKLRKTPAPLVIFWFCLCNVILGAAGLCVVDHFRWPAGWYCWTLVIMTTIFSALDQFFITLALKLENAGAVAVIQALCVVLSFVFSILILHEHLYWTSALGGTFIFLSVIVLGIAKVCHEVGYARLKSSIFHINLLLHYSSSKYSFNSKLSLETNQSSVSSTPPLSNSSSKEHILEPYLLRIAPISTDTKWSTISEIDLNNNKNFNQQ